MDAVRGVATPMPALASAGAAGAASWLRRLGADPARARLAPHDGTREGPRVVVCKTLACVLEAETTRRLLCVLPLAAEVCACWGGRLCKDLGSGKFGRPDDP